MSSSTGATRKRGGSRPTISDVAATAGVSTATVSRVLNGHSVADETAARVQEAVELLDYTSNALTRGVFAGRSKTIGVVIQDLQSPFYLELMRGIDEEAAAHGSPVTFASTFGQRDQEPDHLRTMDEQRVRGLIITTGPDADARPRRMAAEGTPCVIVARRVEEPTENLHSISLDNLEAGRLIGSHVLSRGRMSIAVVTAAGGYQSQRERLLGVEAVIEETAAADLVHLDAASGSDVKKELSKLFAARAPSKPIDALVCLTGRLTLAAYQTLRSLNVAIADEVAFAAMDDFPWAEELGLTVVTQPSYEMGREAARLAATAPPEPVQLVLKPELIVRTSCGESPAQPDKDY